MHRRRFPYQPPPNAHARRWPGNQTRHPASIALLVAMALGAAACAPSSSSTTGDATSAGPRAAASSPSRAGATGTRPGGATDPPPAPPAPTSVTGADAGDQTVAPIAWTPCGTIECGTLAVPLDTMKPASGSGATLDLAVARRRATDPSRRNGTLFFNPGGPGGSGVDYLKATGLGGALDQRFDIVSWDPRGVGASRAIECDDGTSAYRDLDWSPDDAVEQRALDQAARDIAAGCAQRFRDLIGHVSTDDTVRDLDRLRRAVGDAQLSFIGLSYGTFIGLRYAELYPTKVRAIVLDGVVDPSEDLEGLLSGQTQALDNRMNEIFASCKPPGCALGNAAAAYDRVAARVDQQPIPAGRATLGPTTLAFAAVSASYESGSGANFLAALAAADRGNGTAMHQIADRYWSTASFTSYLAIICADSPHPTGADGYRNMAERLKAISPRFGAAIANEVLPCAFWDAPVGNTDAIRAHGSAPILVVGNTGDVATPYAAAQRVAAQLESAVLLSYQGTGHTSLGKSNCVDKAVEAYLIDLRTPNPDTLCQ